MPPRKSTRSAKKSSFDNLPRAGGDLVPAAEYARAVGIAKSQMSAWFHRGLPFIDGKDAEGRRNCKLVDLAAADAWRMANTDVRVDASGKLRGLNMASDLPRGVTTPVVRTTPAAGEGVSPPLAKQGAAGTGETAPPPAGEPVLTPQQIATARIAEAKARESEMAMEMRGLALASKRGDLIDREAAMEILGAFTQGLGAILERKPAERAAMIAAELGTTTHLAMLTTRRIMDELRVELAKLADSIARDLERTGRP